jgi:hypothetical protein
VRLGTDGGEKLGDTVAAKFNLGDEIIQGSTIKFIWRVVFRGHHCGHSKWVGLGKKISYGWPLVGWNPEMFYLFF